RYPPALEEQTGIVEFLLELVLEAVRPGAHIQGHRIAEQGQSQSARRYQVGGNEVEVFRAAARIAVCGNHATHYRLNALAVERRHQVAGNGKHAIARIGQPELAEADSGTFTEDR